VVLGNDWCQTFKGTKGCGQWKNYMKLVEEEEKRIFFWE
jgi:hypothetical protein